MSGPAKSTPALLVSTNAGILPTAHRGGRKQRLGTIAVIQIGLFLSATLASVIGGAWTNVMQSDFDDSIEHLTAQMATSGDPAVTAQAKAEALQRYTASAQRSKRRNLQYALFVTAIGLIIIIGWTLFVQEIDPSLISYVEPS